MHVPEPAVHIDTAKIQTRGFRHNRHPVAMMGEVLHEQGDVAIANREGDAGQQTAQAVNCHLCEGLGQCFLQTPAQRRAYIRSCSCFHADRAKNTQLGREGAVHCFMQGDQAAGAGGASFARDSAKALANVLPSVCTIEEADSELPKRDWFKESHVHLNFAPRVLAHGVDVGCAATSSAPHEPPRSLAPHVLFRRTWFSCNSDRAHREERPQCT